MSDGAFRDDQEAAIARADALERELAREKRENEKLREQNEALAHTAEVEHERAESAEQRAPRPVRPKRPSVPRTEAELVRARRANIGYGLLAVAVAAVLISPWIYSCVHKNAKADRAQAVDRWDATRYAPVCLRNALNAFSWEKHDELDSDPRKPASWYPDFTDQAMSDRCKKRLAILSARPAYAGIADNLRRWIAAAVDYEAVAGTAANYYAGGHWRDDAYASAPAKWKAVRAAAAAVAVAADGVRDRLIATTHAELRRYQTEYRSRNGEDATWWQLELGNLVQVAADEYRFGDRAKVDAEIAAFEAREKDAPPDVRALAVSAAAQNLRSKKLFYNDLIKDLEPVP